MRLLGIQNLFLIAVNSCYERRGEMHFGGRRRRLDRTCVTILHRIFSIGLLLVFNRRENGTWIAKKSIATAEKDVGYERDSDAIFVCLTFGIILMIKLYFRS